MPKYEILRHVVGPTNVGSLPDKIVEEILSYLPTTAVTALCQVYPNVLKIVCEQNRTRYFGYRKHLAVIFMPAIIYGAYERVEGEEVEEHSIGAKRLATVICNELGRDR
ncbi:hypothetical protein TWF481_004514 [Arthrobotrys musiformis]|uniref:F-box domain-containing protein n=1 Tax=Arthrobotrys musiformis TaxID=47236 RepID=A0AAV9WLN9_9PEZI